MHPSISLTISIAQATYVIESLFLFLSVQAVGLQRFFEYFLAYCNAGEDLLVNILGNGKSSINVVKMR